MKAEEVLNNSVGSLSTFVKDTAGATHALTCGVLDRESNETRKEMTGSLAALDDPLKAVLTRRPRKWCECSGHSRIQG